MTVSLAGQSLLLYGHRSLVHLLPLRHLSFAYKLTPINHSQVAEGFVFHTVPVGIITKEKVALKLSRRYGYTLYQNKPVSLVMDTSFLSFDSKTPINIVATDAMDRPNDTLYDFIVITEEEKYIGTVTIKRMFQKSLELKVMTAQQQSPLTGLPGNMLIQQKLSEFIDSQKNYSVAYLDIDYFKAYNDVYGFEKGDAIIKLLADILEEFIPNNQFIGHIGGDDFIVAYDEIIGYEDLMPINDIFEKAVINLYSKEDLENGFITATNRQGSIEKNAINWLNNSHC